MSSYPSEISAENYKNNFIAANNFVEQGKYFEAETLYDALVIESGGLDASLLCKLGDLQYKKNNFYLALNILESAISIDTDFAWGYVCKAEVCEAIGKFSEALECLNFVAKNFNGFDFIETRIKDLNDLIKDSSEPSPEVFTWPRTIASEKISNSLRIAIIAWDITHNPVGRAWTLCEIAKSLGAVTLLGPMNESFGRDLWEPLRDTPREFDITTFRVQDFSGLMNACIEMVQRDKFDVVIVSKARFPSMLIGLLYKLIHGSKIIIDVDDDELSFVGADEELLLDNFINTFQSSHWEKSYGKGWTQFASSLIKYFDGITTCNEAFNKKFGGTILRHARDHTHPTANIIDQHIIDQTRAEFKLQEDDWVILFLGTARKYKGLETLAKAIDITANSNIVLIVAGHLSRDIKNSLENIQGIRIVYHPVLPFQSMGRLYSIANCICLIQDTDSTSANWQTPAKISDALRFGVPIIATSTLGISELIECGVVLKTDPDPHSVAHSLKSLYSDSRENINNLKQVMYDIFTQEFSVQANSVRLKKYIAEVKNKKPVDIAVVFGKLLKFIDKRMPNILSDSWHERFSECIIKRPSAKKLISTHSNLNIVFFWKQNDTGIFDRRHDMLLQELAEKPTISRILQIDAPICVDDVLKGLSLDPFNHSHKKLISQMAIQRHLGVLDSDNIYRRTFIYRGKETHLLGQELPILSEFPNYVEQWMQNAKIIDNVMAWVCPIVHGFKHIQNRIGFNFILADIIDDQRHFKQKASALRKINESYDDIIKLADLIITNTRHNLVWTRQEGANPVLIPNAMSRIADGSKWVKPEALKKLEGPIIGYAGNMRERFDWSLVETIAALRPEWNLVLIGTLPDANTYKDLLKYSNVYLLGELPASIAMHYIYFFDVGIIPHFNNKLAQSMNPLKLYVYRALGLDVVSTDIPNLDIIDAAVTIAAADKSFIDAVENALLRRSSDGRLFMNEAEISRHSWSARMSQIFELINQKVERH